MLTPTPPAPPVSPPVEGSGVKARTRELLGVLTAEEREGLFRPSLPHTLLTFGHIWVSLGLAFLAIGPVASWPWAARLPASILLIVFIGTRQNALAVQVHEAAHHLLMRPRRANDLFGNGFAAYWVLNDVGAYRRVHHRHHVHLHEDDDPDLGLYRVSPRGGWIGGGAMLLESLLGISSLRRIAQYLRSGRPGPDAGRSTAQLGHVAAKLLAQGAIAAIFAWRFGLRAGAANFFWFWVVPLFSIMPTILRMRIVAEHFSPELHGDRAGLFVSRTTAANALEAYFIGAEMQYHFEHHLIPSIPHHRLARLHRLLVGRGYFERPEDDRDRCLSGGYARFWWRLLRGRVGVRAESS